jgi:hypothetical protein
LESKKIALVELLCFVGIIMLIDSASRTLFVQTVGTPSSSIFYFGLKGAFAPFENLEGSIGTLLAMIPLFVLAFTRAQITRLPRKVY